MPCPKRTTAPSEHFGVVVDLAAHPIARERGVEPSLRCVSSGYMSGGCSCARSVPTSVVTAAWAAELGRSGEHSRMFHFAWRGEVWLAFGLGDGTIRGVYCAEHRARREARSAGCEAQHYARSVAALG
jgi:hypothetical protein